MKRIEPSFVADHDIPSSESFDSLFRRLQPGLVLFLTRMLDGTAIDPEDIAQESMAKAWAKREQYDPQFQFSTWVYTIARRTATDHLRRKPVSTVDSVERLCCSRDTPAESIQSRDSAANLWDLAQKLLSSEQFSALWLRYGEDLEIGEVARVLNRSTVSTRVILHRARTKLQSQLRVTEDDANGPGAADP